MEKSPLLVPNILLLLILLAAGRTDNYTVDYHILLPPFFSGGVFLFLLCFIVLDDLVFVFRCACCGTACRATTTTRE